MFFIKTRANTTNINKCGRFVSFEMVEMPRRGLNWLVKNLGYL